MKQKLYITCVCLALSGISLAQSVYPGQYREKMKKEVSIPLQVESFDLQDVRLLPSRFRENMERDSAWMVSIGTDRLLHSFRTNAGVYAGREGGYMTVKKLGGWESLDCELRGHTTGHLLSAYGLMYAATGSEVFKLKGDSLVNGLAEVQQALGNGYLSAFPEELINRNIRGTSVWAPWYTLHKLFSGLIDQYLYADNRQALEVVKRMGDWAYNKLKPLDETTRRRMIRNEFGGINESFYNLYAITGDERYEWLARYFYHNDVIDPLKEQRDDLGTKHTNTFIPKVLAEARNYELNGSEDSRQATDFFWHTMIARHTFAPGCSSQKEHFFDPAAHFYDSPVLSNLPQHLFRLYRNRKVIVQVPADNHEEIPVPFLQDRNHCTRVSRGKMAYLLRSFHKRLGPYRNPGACMCDRNKFCIKKHLCVILDFLIHLPDHIVSRAR